MEETLFNILISYNDGNNWDIIAENVADIYEYNWIKYI